MNSFANNRLFTIFLLLTGGILMAGRMSGLAGESSTNVFISSPRLPAEIKRVVMLPLACDESRADLADDCEKLGPVCQAELIKTKLFEVVSADAETLRISTGKLSWTGAEALPGNFFESLNRVYGCDAVLFCQLTALHAYAPLAIGWRMKLVDSHTKKIIWAADELFDAGNPETAKKAQEYQSHAQHTDVKSKSFFKLLFTYANRETPPVGDQWDILNSPHFFGQYAAAALLATLPHR
jgi:hypothetical protein